MYAVVRRNTFDPEKLAAGGAALEEFQARHAAQPGYRGTVVVDVGEGQWLLVNLWETKEDGMRAWPALVPEVKRLLEPLMAAPSEFVGAGPVVQTDLRAA